MTILRLFILTLVAASGTAVVFTRKPSEQAIGVSFFGLMLTLMFYIFQAPDVALSQVVIGAVALPLMILLAVARVRRLEIEQRQKKEKDAKPDGASNDPQGPDVPSSEQQPA